MPRRDRSSGALGEPAGSKLPSVHQPALDRAVRSATVGMMISFPNSLTALMRTHHDLFAGIAGLARARWVLPGAGVSGAERAWPTSIGLTVWLANRRTSRG
jgi:hypothetical protein